tara:strand:- start:109 stop:444 length:336 start_codon:yes stop_codon:yes gene_type:complete
MHGEKKSTLDKADALGHSLHNLGNDNMSIKSDAVTSVPRKMYREMESYGMPMQAYRIKGERGGLLREYSQSNPDCPLTLFIESMDGQTQWTHTRSDGTVFNIRINGANEKA